MPGFLIAALIGVVGFLFGVALTLLVGRDSGEPAQREEGLDPDCSPGELDAETDRSRHVIALIARALRDPLHLLRRGGDPGKGIARLERVAWRARMLASRPRPMQSQPVSPIALLQEAAQEVELVRLGKVAASWGLLTRQPVYVDPARSRAAFRELLTAAAESAGEGARIAIRIHEGCRDGYPVQIEIEVGRRGSELEALPCRVARHLLLSQGARFEVDGGVVRVELRSIPS